ncbi:MAG: hypothetical protein AB7S41_11315 [Parvibaculaceae bacterium]
MPSWECHCSCGWSVKRDYEDPSLKTPTRRAVIALAEHHRLGECPPLKKEGEG